MDDSGAYLGVGLGFRPEIADQIRRARAQIDFLELITESCFAAASDSQLSLCEGFPLVCHGIQMSLGAMDPLDESYVDALCGVLERVKPAWFSDHLAMTKVAGVDIGHLAPVTLTEQTVATVVTKIRQIQARTQTPLLIENVTYYFEVPGATLTEAEVLTQVVERADCGILLDLNNLLANARNHMFDPYKFLEGIPLERAVQIHLAGGAWREGLYLDTHAHAIEEEVWKLLAYVCRRAPLRGILLERDANWLPFDQVLAELERARSVVGAPRNGS